MTIQRGSGQRLPFVDVRDFGATGDGATDDTSFIQAALDAVPANGGIVYFPNGTYKVTSVLTVSKPCTRLLGPGRRQRIATLAPVIINYTGTGNVINITGNQGFVCEFLHFNYPAQSGTVINASNVASGFVRGCHFVGTSKNGKAIDINDGSGWSFYDVDIEYFDIGIDLQQNNGDSLLSNVSVSLCNTGTRIGKLGSTVGVAMYGLDYELNAIGIDLLNAHSIHIGGSYFEQDTNSFILRCSGDAGSVPTNISMCGCYGNGGGVSEYMIQLLKVNGFSISNMLTVNYTMGLIRNDHTNVSGVSIEGCDNIVPSGAQINDLTGVVSYKLGSLSGFGPVKPETLVHLKTDGSSLPRITYDVTGVRKWILGADSSPDKFFLYDSTSSVYAFHVLGSSGYVGFGEGTPGNRVVIGANSDTTNINARINGKTSTGSSAGTLTNAPSAGNPVGYLSVSINGTERKIPYW